MLAEDKVTTVRDLLQGVAAKLDVDLGDPGRARNRPGRLRVESIARNLRSRENSGP
jgi:hypothetical protein